MTGNNSQSASLTLFGLPKPFRGHIETIQRNAIRSWTELKPAPEILLFGDDEGTAEIAQEFGLRHIPNVRRNEFGTPLMGDLFRQAQSVAAHDTLCYVNSDIILLADFPQAVERIARFRDKFLMVGRRLDLDLAEPLRFDADGWEASLRSRALSQGTMNIARSIDYFVFPRNLYPSLPEMALGRFWWDNWLIWKAHAVGAVVVDATAVVLAIHQNHDHSHYAGGREAMLAGEEAARNCRLGCETNPADFENGLYWRYFYTIDDATHVLTRDGIKPTSRHTWKMVKRTLGNPRSLPALIRQTLVGVR
ncbi:MAG: hypothetical protein ACHP7P_02040 [Terriglobales bacterium]